MGLGKVGGKGGGESGVVVGGGTLQGLFDSLLVHLEITSSATVQGSTFVYNDFNEVLPLEDQYYFYNMFREFVGGVFPADAPPSPPSTPTEDRQLYAVATIHCTTMSHGELLQDVVKFTSRPFPINGSLHHCYRKQVVDPILKFMVRCIDPYLGHIAYFWSDQ